MRLRNVIGATLAFTYIFYTLSFQAQTPRRSTRTPKAAATTEKKTVARLPATPVTKKKIGKAPQEQQAEEEDVPWKELRAEFMSTLRERMAELAPDKAKTIMTNYEIEHESFNKKIEVLLKERNRYFYFDKEQEKVVFKNKAKYKELNKKVTDSFEDYDSKIETIFADHYPAVMELRAEFEDYMQLYNRHEHLIGIEL